MRFDHDHNEGEWVDALATLNEGLLWLEDLDQDAPPQPPESMVLFVAEAWMDEESRAFVGAHENAPAGAVLGYIAAYSPRATFQLQPYRPRWHVWDYPGGRVDAPRQRFQGEVGPALCQSFEPSFAAAVASAVSSCADPSRRP